MIARPFCPAGNTVRFAAPGTTSGAQAVPGLVSGFGVVRVFNSTNQIINIAFGESGIVASAVASAGNGVRIASSRTETITVPGGATHVAVVAAAASTGDVFVTPGFGPTN